MLTRKIAMQDANSTAAYKQARNAYDKASATFRSNPARWKSAREILRKKADFGDNQNPQFEQAFGSIAFTYLEEKAPGLIPYVMGFQLLEREDKGKRAVGAFVAQLGDKTIDIPMFFINGELKGHQVMRLRNPELFIPLRESFLDYLFSKLPQDLGEAGPSLSEYDPTRSTPNIQPFSGSRYSKIGEDRGWLHDWAIKAGIADEYAAMRHSPKNLELGIALLDKKKNAHCNIVDLMLTTGSRSMLKTAVALCDAYPRFGQHMTEMHGDTWVQRVAKVAYAIPAKPSLSTHQPVLSLVTKTASARPDLTFTTACRGRVLGKGIDWDNIDREIETFGEYANDQRGQDKIAEAYKVEEMCATMTAPDDVGLYNVLDKDSKKKQMLVIPSMNRLPTNQYDIVIDMKSKKWCQADRNRYVAYQPKDERGAYKSELDKVMKSNSKRPSEGDVFCVFLKDEIAGPFICKSKAGQDRYDVEDISSWMVALPNDVNVGSQSYGCCDSDASITSIIFNEDAHDSRISGGHKGTLTLPKAQRVFVFGKRESDSHGLSCCDEYYFEDRAFKDKFQLDLFDRNNLQMHEFAKYANLQVRRKASNEVEVNSVTMRAGHARRFLMQDVGLSKEAAEEIIAGPMSTTRYIVKAPGKKFASLTDVKKLGYYSPPVEFPPEQQPYSSESGAYAIEDAPEQHITQAEADPTREPLEPWQDPQGGGNPQMHAMGQQTMESDPSDTMADMVGLISILRNNRVDTTIKATTKALLSAIDRLGRQIVTFHAHPQEFEDLYGESDMVDLEAAMVSAFEQAGDLFITLTRRASDMHPELDVADLPAE